MRNFRPSIIATPKLPQYFLDFRVFIAVIIKVSDILDDRADLISSLASLHDHGKGRDVGRHVPTVLKGYFRCIFDIAKGLS
jgi:hypothetical protein